MGRSSTASDRWLEVGSLGRSHGVRGEIYLRPINPDTDLLTKGRVFRAAVGQSSQEQCDEGAPETGAESRARELVIERVRRTGKGWLVKFEGVDQREVAAALTNRKLYVRRHELPSLDPDEYYWADLVGLLVKDQRNRKVGAIVGIFDNGAHDVCVIQSGDGEEILVPFLPESLLDFDLDQGLVRLDVPEGIPGLEEEETGGEGET